MENLIEVTLIAPAKVNGARKKVGAKAYVTKEVRDQLAASGAVVKLPEADGEGEQPPSEFDVAVRAVAQDIAAAAVGEAVTQLVEDVEKAEARAKAATERADLLEAERADVEAGRDNMAGRAEQAEAKVTELEDQIATLKQSEPEQADPEPADKKSAPRKAAEKKTGTKSAAKGKAT